MKTHEHRPTPFGDLVNHHRKAAGLSMRALALEVGVSGVAVSNVIRGKARALHQKHWSALMVALPGLSRASLEQADIDSRPTELRPWLYDGEQRDAITALARLARRVDRGELGDEDMALLCRAARERVL